VAIDRTAPSRVQRLMRWLEPINVAFWAIHRAQRLALGTRVHGLFSEGGRTSMQAMLICVTDPITYQGFWSRTTVLTRHADRDDQPTTAFGQHVEQSSPDAVCVPGHVRDEVSPETVAR